jgi:hypothetical protein
MKRKGSMTKDPVLRGAARKAFQAERRAQGLARDQRVQPPMSPPLTLAPQAQPPMPQAQAPMPQGQLPGIDQFAQMPLGNTTPQMQDKMYRFPLIPQMSQPPTNMYGNQPQPMPQQNQQMYGAAVQDSMASMGQTPSMQNVAQVVGRPAFIPNWMRRG